MKIYKTVSEVRQAMDKYLRAQGDGRDGAHYKRRDGSRGPILHYLRYPLGVSIAVDRAEGGGWIVSNVWNGSEKLHPYYLSEFQNAEAGE